MSPGPSPSSRRSRNSDHPRNMGPMRESMRCGAKTRSGGACQSPAVRGKRRCRMHGGAPGSGAPKGNLNAFKHGNYRKEAIEERKEMHGLLRDLARLIREER